jgi:hypothetical protein
VLLAAGDAAGLAGDFLPALGAGDVDLGVASAEAARLASKAALALVSRPNVNSSKQPQGSEVDSAWGGT